MARGRIDYRENDLFSNIYFNGRGLDFRGAKLEPPLMTSLRKIHGDSVDLSSLKGMSPHSIITNIKNSYGSDLRNASKVLRGRDKSDLKRIVDIVWNDRNAFFKDKVRYYSKDWHKNLFYSEYFYFKEYKDGDKKALLEKFKVVDENISFDVIFYCLFWSDIEYILNMMKIIYLDVNWQKYISWDNPLEQLMQSQRSAYFALSIANQINGTGELNVSVDESQYKDMVEKFYENRKKGGRKTADYWKKEQDKLYNVWKLFPDSVKKKNKASLDLLIKKTNTGLSSRKLEEYFRYWRSIEKDTQG